MEQHLPEEQLIEYIKPYLKAKSFKKKNKRWTKDTGEFTLCFYIQGSSYSKEDYYIRPGIFINALMPCDSYGLFGAKYPPPLRKMWQTNLTIGAKNGQISL